LTKIYLDETSFEKLFRENFLGLCIHCKFKYGFDVDLCKEVVHVAFIKLWESRTLINSIDHAKPFLFMALANVCKDMLRHEKVKLKHRTLVLREGEDAHEEDNGLEQYELKQLKLNIERSVYELPPQMRRIFEMSRYEGLKYSEIATRLSISIKTVETQMGRAILKLKQKMKEYLAFF
jgi:RNA polymerase sigma-70 factor (ECF subfamily)